MKRRIKLILLAVPSLIIALGAFPVGFYYDATVGAYLFPLYYDQREVVKNGDYGAKYTLSCPECLNRLYYKINYRLARVGLYGCHRDSIAGVGNVS